MSFKTDLTEVLQTGTSKVVYWDVTPPGVTLDENVIICQRVGGRPTARYVDRKTKPGYGHARVNITGYARRGTDRDNLMALIGNVLRECDFFIEPVTEPIDGHDNALNLYESTQQFEFWYPDP
jgi:hypothetical protein